MIDAEYTLETPENVELEFELAGPGSRFCAVLIDWLVIGCLGLILLIVALVVSFSAVASLAPEDLFDPHAAEAYSWVLAMVVAAFAVLSAGYHALFEIFMHGQTPGKRAMKIRAICDDGTAMGASQALIRNLLRTVDFLPAGYVLGGIVALLSQSHKRIGDLAAGTIVVKEAELDFRARTDQRYEVASASRSASTTTSPLLSESERQLVQRFLDRRHELLLDARSTLATDLAKRLHERHGGSLQDPEPYLEALMQGRQHER